jgi:hypothetical protein
MLCEEDTCRRHDVYETISHPQPSAFCVVKAVAPGVTNPREPLLGRLRFTVLHSFHAGQRKFQVIRIETCGM